MKHFRLCDLRAFLFALVAGLFSLDVQSVSGQFATPLETTARYAGNSTGIAGYNGDSGTAAVTSLNAPTYVVLDSLGNLFVADTGNNCVRKIDSSGNITTVAGLRVSGGPDTCNPVTNPTPTPAQGLNGPTGLAVDSANTLYIADSHHNCVRALASGTVDSFAQNALTTVVGTCSSTNAASITPVPDGLTVDSTGNLYVSVQDTVDPTPIGQVVLHRASDPATTACYLVGLASANVATACAGVTGSVALSHPAGLTFDVNGNLYVADSFNNCVREIAGLTTPQTVVGRCTNDGSGSATTTLYVPYGLAFSTTGTLLIANSSFQNADVVSFAPGSGTLTLIAGTSPNGGSGPYLSIHDGGSAISSAVGEPAGIAADTQGNIYIGDALSNIVRRLNPGTIFPAIAVGSSETEIINLALNQPVSLTETTGPDYTFSSNNCTGSVVIPEYAVNQLTCSMAVQFTPTLPGQRNSPLRLKDSISGGTVTIPLSGVGTGPLSLFTPGTVSTAAAGLRTPLAVAIDSSGAAYILEQGNGSSTADVLKIPGGGGSPQTVVAQGNGLGTPTAMAVDGAGNIFITDAALQAVARFGADGSVNLSYATGLIAPTAVAVDAFDNLYIAQSGSAHNIVEIYAGGLRRTIAGSGSTANASGVTATSALFVAPSAIALGPNGSLCIADASGHLVYTINSSGTISIVAGNGTTTTADPTQALGTALLTPVGVAFDAAGDIYISDQASNRVYEVYPVETAGSNITTQLGTGVGGYSGDSGLGPNATIQGPLGLGLDGSGDMFVVDGGNGAVREVTYLIPPTLDFGHVIIGTTSVAKSQSISNAGNANLSLTTPFATSDTHFAESATTCSTSLVAGGLCDVSYTFSPTALGPLSATSAVVSNSYNSPQKIDLTGYGLFTQQLPYTLLPQTEVYGQPFTETATINLVFPDLVPTGTITYSIGGKTICSTTGNFPGVVNCAAGASGLGIGTYTVTFTFTTGDVSYFSTVGTTTLTITAAPLTVTPANASKVYGAAVPTLTAAVTGAVNGDLFLASVSTTATTASPVGTYPISATLTGVGLANLNNYSVTYNTGTLTVTAAPLNVTVANVTRPYGQPNPTFTGTVTGAVNGDTFTVLYTTAATVASPVGTYPITGLITGTNLANYSVTSTPGTLTITQAPLSVTVSNATRAYGAANPIFSVTVNGALNGDTFTNAFSTTATASSPVGTYPINDTVTGPAATNYSITVVPGSLSITQATTVLNITVNNVSRLYGTVNPAFTSTVTGALNGDSLAVTYATTATVISPVGAYGITATVSGPALSNYANVTVTPGTLTVAPATLTVTVANASRVYATANPAFTSTTTGALNGDTFTNTYSTTATISSAVGSYPINDTVGGPAAANYTIVVVPGTLTITQSTAALVFTANNATRTYGAANPVFTGTVTGALNGDSFTVSYITTAAVTSPIGSYTITPVVSGAALANYSTVTKTNGTLTVTVAQATITVTNTSRVYGAPNPTFSSTTTGALNGDTFTNTFSTTATSASPVGGYPITDVVSGAAAANYTITVVPGTLTITPAALTVIANNASRPYATTNPTLTGSVSGLLNGDSVSVGYSTSASAASPVGTYAIVPTVTGAALTNYSLSITNGTLTVTPVSLTVTVANATRFYGASNPPFTGTVAGLLNGDTVTNNFSTTATIVSPVGTYPITDAISGPAASNYILTVIPGTLTITPAPVALVITANNASRLYGAANPAFTSTVTGALNGDTFTITYATTAGIGSSVGSYPIVPSVSGAALLNYNLVTVNGTLAVTPAPLSVSANNATRPYGAANPSFTGTVTGLLNGDVVTVSYATPATVTSAVGTYPIVPMVTGAALSNYAPITNNGTLTITPTTTPLVVTVSNATRVYGQPNPTFIGTITGLINGDTVTVTNSTTATVASPSGQYPITAVVSGAAAANYTITIVPGVLTITPAPTATTIATSASPVVVTNSVIFTATVTSASGTPGGTVQFFNGSTLLGSSALNSSGIASFTTSTLPAGSDTVTATYVASTNYASSSASLTELVSPGSFTIAVNPPSQYIRGPGTTIYTITATSTNNFSGPVALTCTGLPADDTCVFGATTLTLTANASATTTMTVVNTNADALLAAPRLTTPRQAPTKSFAPGSVSAITAAAVLPFGFTGLGTLLTAFARVRRRRVAETGTRWSRLALPLLCGLVMLGLAGCACFTSVYKTYNVVITGTSSVAGTAPQSATLSFTVGED